MAGHVNKKNAKFFCENCGAEVPQNAKFCKKCGKFFTFVRCPNCSFTGDAGKFTHGCPKCGYAVAPYGSTQPAPTAPDNPKKKNKFAPPFFNRQKKEDFVPKTKNYDSSLPIWVYIVTIIVLLAVVFGVYSCL